MEMKSIGVVRKNDSVLPSGNATCRIGFVNEVNGAGAEEVAGYVPTRREVVELVKYWYSRVLDNDWFYFSCGQAGSSEWRLDVYAQRRISRAAAVIGQEAVDMAIKEAREKFRKEINDERL